MLFLTPEQTAAVANISLTPDEEERLELVKAWAETGAAYAIEHATRPSTVSLVLNTNPLGMLAWWVSTDLALQGRADVGQDGREIHRMERQSQLGALVS